MKQSLESTGLPRHISLAVGKSTPHGETNHVVQVLLPVKGKRIVRPVDAVYTVDEETSVIEGETGCDLAKQIVTVLEDKLDLEDKDMHYMRGIYFKLQ